MYPSRRHPEDSRPRSSKTDVNSPGDSRPRTPSNRSVSDLWGSSSRDSSPPYSESGPDRPFSRQGMLCGLDRFYQIDYFIGYCVATMRECMQPIRQYLPSCPAAKFSRNRYREDVLPNRLRRPPPQRDPKAHAPDIEHTNVRMDTTPPPPSILSAPQPNPNDITAEEFATVKEDLHARLWDIRKASETLLDEANKDGMDIAGDELRKTTVISKLVYLPVRELDVHVRRIRTAVEWSPVDQGLITWTVVLTDALGPTHEIFTWIRLNAATLVSRFAEENDLVQLAAAIQHIASTLRDLCVIVTDRIDLDDDSPQSMLRRAAIAKCFEAMYSAGDKLLDLVKQRVNNRDDFDNWGYTRMVAISNGVSEPQMKREMTNLKRVQGVSVLTSLTGGFGAPKALDTLALTVELPHVPERVMMRSERGIGSGPVVAMPGTRRELKRFSEGLSLGIDEYRQSLRKVHLWMNRNVTSSNTLVHNARDEGSGFDGGHELGRRGGRWGR